LESLDFSNFSQRRPITDIGLIATMVTMPVALSPFRQAKIAFGPLPIMLVALSNHSGGVDHEHNTN
jgi:hypothetical protein